MVFLVLAFAIANPPSTWAGMLLVNGGFDTPTSGLTPPNYPTSISGAGVHGISSADSWTLYNNFDATTSTELLPSTDPTGGGFMIHLTSVTNNAGDPTSSFFNGLQQSFPTASGGTASADVFVLSGPVILALYTGNGSTLISDTFSTVTNQWQTLTTTAPVGSNPDLVILYSYSTAGTGEFYADNAIVESAAVPEPSTLTLLGIGAAGLGTFGLRRRKRDLV
jgi:hypothetical protein